MNKSLVQPNTKGAAMLIFVVLFLMASLGLTFMLSNSAYADARGFRLAYDSMQSYLTADAGVEDVAYRYRAGLIPDATETIVLNGAIATTTSVYDNVDDIYVIESQSVDNNAYRGASMSLFIGNGASFNFGVQAGNGGFEMTNGSSVIGNVFANGTVEKTGGGTATIYGDVISAGPAGLIKRINTTGSAWAHVIENSNVDGRAYAYTINGGSVDNGAEYFEAIGGASIIGSPIISGVIVGDEATTSMPISDEQIETMKQDILDNGTVIASTSPQCSSGTYVINSNTTLGFVKIECNFELQKQGAGTTLTLNGPIWVEGNILFKSGPILRVAGSVGNKTVPIIADDPSDSAGSGLISVENGTDFFGNGGNKSYILLLSQNNDAETGGAENVNAISLGQSSEGDLLIYAGHGRINLANSTSLNEITGYRIRLGNSTQVTYESGLVNLLFTSGPGGGYTISNWRE